MHTDTFTDPSTSNYGPDATIGAGAPSSLPRINAALGERSGAVTWLLPDATDAGYENADELVFAALVDLVRAYSASSGCPADLTLQAIAENLEA